MSQLNKRDKRRLAAYMSLSLAAKYSERVAFKMSTAAVQFSSTSQHETVLTPMNLRLMEFELMQRLNFKVGESAEGAR